MASYSLTPPVQPVVPLEMSKLVVLLAAPNDTNWMGTVTVVAATPLTPILLSAVRAVRPIVVRARFVKVTIPLASVVLT